MEEASPIQLGYQTPGASKPRRVSPDVFLNLVVVFLTLPCNALLLMLLRETTPAKYPWWAGSQAAFTLRILYAGEILASLLWSVLLLITAVALARNDRRTVRLFRLYAYGKVLLVGVAIASAAWGEATNTFASGFAAIYGIAALFGFAHPLLLLIAIWSAQRRQRDLQEEG